MLSNLENIMKERRSIKKFKKDPVDVNEIIDLLNIAKWAPNHKLTEPWRFQLYADEGKEKFVDAFLKSQMNEGSVPEKAEKKAQYFRDIPLHLIVYMTEPERQKQWDEDFAAVAAFIQNFQLAAWERGIGMIWRSNDWIYDPVFKEAVGIKADEKIIGTLMIGYPAHVPEVQERTDVREFLTLIDQ